MVDVVSAQIDALASMDLPDVAVKLVKFIFFFFFFLKYTCIQQACHIPRRRVACFIFLEKMEENMTVINTLKQ